MARSVAMKIARRYLASRKAHSAVNLISIVAICGIAVTTMATVCVLSVFNGFAGLINSRLARIDPDIAITATAGKVIANADSLADALSSREGVAMALPTLTDNALAVFENRQMPVRLKGVPDGYDSLTVISSLVKDDGDYLLHYDSLQFALLSVGAAIELRAHPGYSLLHLYAPQRQGRINLANPLDALVADSAAIAGVFQVDNQAYDDNTIIISLPLARSLFDYTTEATAVELKVAAGYNPDRLMSRLQAELGSVYRVANRLMQEEKSYRLVNIEKWVTFLLLAFILVIAAFNVVSTIAVMIVEKRRDIATMRTFGASPSFITSIFKSQTWLINLIGGIAGIVLGTALCLAQQHFGLLRFNADSDMVLVEAYPVELQWPDILIVAALVAAVSLAASAIVALLLRRR